MREDVCNLPLEHVGHRRLPSVRMVREPSAFSNAEVVEHKKRGEVAQLLASYRASNDDAVSLVQCEQRHENGLNKTYLGCLHGQNLPLHLPRY